MEGFRRLEELSTYLGIDLLARSGVRKLLDSGNSHRLGAFTPMRDTSGGKTN